MFWRFGRWSFAPLLCGTPTQVNAGGYVAGTLPGVYAFDDNRTRNHDELAAVLVEEVEAAPSPSHLAG